MVKIKICGLMRPEEIEAVNRLHPDFAGFVFAPGRHQVSEELAKDLGRLLAPEIQKTGVFVNENPEKIRRLCENGVIDVIQLHGEEPAEEIRYLKETTKKQIIKAVRVREQEQVLEAEALPCDLLLLDTYLPGMCGGSGKDFPLSRIPALKKPFLLAGGLRAGNVREKIRACRPWGVDVSSGVEKDGRKTEEQMRQFVEVVRDEERKI